MSATSASALNGVIEFKKENKKKPLGGGKKLLLDPIYYFLLVFNSSIIWHNSTDCGDVRVSNMIGIDLDLSRSIKLICDDAAGLLLGFPVVNI